MKRLITIGVALAMVMMAFAVISGNAVAEGGPSDWIEYASNPLISGEKHYYPTVLYDEDQFSGNGESAYYKLWCDTSLKYYTSSDGVSWTFVGKISDSTITGLTGTVAHPLIEYYSDGFTGVNSGINPSSGTMYYRLWYWSGALYSVNAMRYSDSPDGKAWYNNQPLQNGAIPIVSGASNTWNRGSYGPADVLYFPGAANTGTDWTFRMYYDGTTGGTESLGLGFSADGITWTGYDSNSDGKADPILVGTTGNWDNNYVSRATIIEIGGAYSMWYSGGNGRMNQGIGFATSSDGMTWTKDSDNPIFYKDDTGASWRDDRTYTPMVIYDTDGFSGNGDAYMYKMWFTGKSLITGKYTIGYAYAVEVALNPTIEDAKDTIDDNVEHRGIANSLRSKLDSAVKQFDKGNEKAGINILKAFINEVEAQKGKKIDSDFADQLIEWAEAWIDDPTLAL